MPRLSEYHPSLVHAERVDVLCAPLRRHHISLFEFGRFFDDGSCWILSNQKHFLKYLIEGEFPLPVKVPEEMIRDSFYYVLPEQGAHQEQLEHLQKKFSIAHGMNCVVRQKGYYDLYCFAAKAGTDRTEMVNFYLNHTIVLNQFVQFFRQQTSELIEQVEKELIHLAPEMRSNFQGLPESAVSSPMEKSFIQERLDAASITKQEYMCLSYMGRGRTARETGAILNLSARTVESHIDRLRTKLQCRRKSEILNAAVKQGLLVREDLLI